MTIRTTIDEYAVELTPMGVKMQVTAPNGQQYIFTRTEAECDGRTSEDLCKGAVAVVYRLEKHSN